MIKVEQREVWEAGAEAKDNIRLAALVEMMTRGQVNLCMLTMPDCGAALRGLAANIISTLVDPIRMIHGTGDVIELHRKHPGLAARLHATMGFLSTVHRESDGNLGYLRTSESLSRAATRALEISGGHADLARVLSLSGAGKYFSAAKTRSDFPARDVEAIAPDIVEARDYFQAALLAAKQAKWTARRQLEALVGLARCHIFLGDKRALDGVLTEANEIPANSSHHPDEDTLWEHEALGHLETLAQTLPDQFRGFIPTTSPMVADEVKIFAGDEAARLRATLASPPEPDLIRAVAVTRGAAGKAVQPGLSVRRAQPPGPTISRRMLMELSNSLGVGGG